MIYFQIDRYDLIEYRPFNGYAINNYAQRIMAR